MARNGNSAHDHNSGLSVSVRLERTGNARSHQTVCDIHAVQPNVPSSAILRNGERFLYLDDDIGGMDVGKFQSERQHQRKSQCLRDGTIGPRTAASSG